MLTSQILSAFMVPLLLSANYRVPIRDGIYLYGEVAKPYQIGKDYLILEVKDSQINGAIYRPGAEYYCLTGEIKGKELELSFVDPNNGQVFHQEIAITSIDGPVASKKLPPNRLTLDGFLPIEKISELDYEIIKSCSTQK